MSWVHPASADNGQQPTRVDGECVPECVWSDKRRKQLVFSVSMSPGRLYSAYSTILMWSTLLLWHSELLKLLLWKCWLWCYLSFTDCQFRILIKSFINWTLVIHFQVIYYKLCYISHYVKSTILWVTPFRVCSKLVMWCRKNVMY